VCAGCVFSGFRGWTVIKAENSAAASFVNCSFFENALFPQDEGAAVIMQDVWSRDLSDEDAAVGAHVRLQRHALTLSQNEVT
jgi:hypothetical protein